MADYYASSGGSAGGDGSLGDPWDLATAFAATATVGAGDTLWLMEQSYTGRFTVALSGTDDANRVEVRPYDGYVVIDMVGGSQTGSDQGMRVTGDFIDLWDIWVTSSNADRWQEQEDGGWKIDGDGVRLFFPGVYDTGDNGFSWFAAAEGGMIHGATTLNNGYDDTDRGHGHAIYSQNNGNATKTIDLCVHGFGMGPESLHIYTEAGQILDYLIKRNVAVDRLLVGGDTPVDDLVADENHVLSSTMQVGFNAGVTNETALVTDNITPDGSVIQVGTWNALTVSGTIDGSARNAVDIMASEYDDDRAVVVVYDAAEADVIEVDLSGLSLTVSREYVLAHHLNPLGQGYTFTWDGSTPVTVRTDAYWTVANALGHDGVDSGSQVPVPPGTAPSRRMAFILAPSARWPATLTEPDAPQAIPDPTPSGNMKAPDEVTGLHSWYKANALLADDDDLIAAWVDSSGNGNDVVQASDTLKPSYKEDILNGYPIVRFGGNDRMAVTFSGGAISQPNTIVVVGKSDVITGTKMVLDGVVSSNRHLLYYESGNAKMFAGSEATGSSGFGTDWELRVAVFNGASSSLAINTVSVISGNAGSHTLTGITIGAPYNGGASSLVGDIAEVCIYDGTVSESDLTALGAYFDAKYALGLGLAPTSSRGLPGHRAPGIGVWIGV